MWFSNFSSVSIVIQDTKSEEYFFKRYFAKFNFITKCDIYWAGEWGTCIDRNHVIFLCVLLHIFSLNFYLGRGGKGEKMTPSLGTSQLNLSTDAREERKTRNHRSFSSSVVLLSLLSLCLPLFYWFQLPGSRVNVHFAISPTKYNYRFLNSIYKTKKTLRWREEGRDLGASGTTSCWIPCCFFFLFLNSRLDTGKTGNL